MVKYKYIERKTNRCNGNDVTFGENLVAMATLGTDPPDKPGVVTPFPLPLHTHTLYLQVLLQVGHYSI